MPLGVIPLTTLCENVLLQNHLLLKDLGDIRFILIKRVLFKFTAQQLVNLEASNPRLILEDEEVWYNLIKREFPQNVHERYTTNASKITLFFKQQLDEVGYDYSNLNLDNYIKIEELGNTKKYRLPSKLLYLKFKDDSLKKEELIIENLRQRMKDIQKLKEERKVVHIKEVIPISPSYSKSRLKPERSKLFQKSQDEARKHKEFFKNPVHGPSVEVPQSLIRPVRHTKMISEKSKQVTPTHQKKQQSPSKIKSQVSIFHKRKPTPKKNSIVSLSKSPIKEKLHPSKVHKPDSTLTKVETPTSIKRIKLEEYISRKP